MKVLMVVKRLRYSGAYKMFMWVAKALADRGFDVTVYTFMSNDVKELPSNIKWIQEDWQHAGFFAQLKALRRIVKSVNAECSISFLLDANILNTFACLGTKTKSVVCERNDPFKPGYYKLKLLKPFFRFAKGAVYQLPRVAEFYKNIKAPTAVIPNPVLCQSNIELKPFSERDKIIVSVGRMDVFQKRQDVLLKAFRLFLKNYQDYKLVFWGDGPDELKVKKMAKEMGLDKNVIFAGVTENPQESIKNAKFFVLSSDFEGIPNALIEAMAIGLPCISTNCRPGGAAVLIENGVNGMLVSPNNVSELAGQMEYIAGNASVADSLGQEAKKIVDVFSEKKITDLWCRYIMDLQKTEYDSVKNVAGENA